MTDFSTKTSSSSAKTIIPQEDLSSVALPNRNYYIATSKPKGAEVAAEFKNAQPLDSNKFADLLTTNPNFIGANLNDYKGFDKVADGNTLFIKDKNSNAVYKLGQYDNQWSSVATILTDEKFIDSMSSTKTKLDNASKDYVLNDYKNHLKFQYAGITIVSHKDSDVFKELSSDKKSWITVTDTELLAELRDLKASAVREPRYNLQTVSKDAVAVRAIGLASPKGVVSLHKLGGIASTHLNPFRNITSLLPSVEVTKDFLESTIETKVRAMANERLATNPRQAIDLVKTGVSLYKDTIQSTGLANSQDLENADQMLEMMNYAKELLGKPMQDRDIPRIKSMLSELDQHYSPERIEALRKAMDTGLINGKAISKEKAKFHYEGGQILNGIKEGRYNTPEGKLSEYGFDMVHTLKYGDLEKDLRQWF